jgi:TonB-dependent SusC/RagA subfamily outer membrane receptor
MLISLRGALGCATLLVAAACGLPNRAGTGAVVPDAAPAPSAEAAATVSGDQLDRSSHESIDKILQGRIPGVVVSRTPDGSIAVRIRGATSVHGSSQPLYLVDGMPIEPGPNGALTGINPYDIASIRVLKDAAETSMYGSRGANGVVVIKTKRSFEPR